MRAVLARMNLQLIRDEGHRNRMSEGELLSRMQAWLAGDYRAVLFADDSQVLGYALFRTEEEFVYLRQLFVRAENRRQGVGRAAIDWLRNNVWGQAPRIRVDVLSGNARAIAFWRSLGFEDYCLTLERPVRDAE